MRVKNFFRSSLFNDVLGITGLRPIITAFRVLFKLERDMGHFKSSARWSSVDKSGNPIPWYSYPSIEFLKTLDLRRKSVFEFGSGNSTLYFSTKAKKVTSVESSERWYLNIKEKTRRRKNVTLIYAPLKNGYTNAISSNRARFDIIIVDGAFRKNTATIALRKLKRDGFIILDNADWFPNTAEFLRSRGLTEVDFTGFGPITPYRTTTSMFFSRHTIFKYLAKSHPPTPIGGIHQITD
ncbi:MAG TPA: class I SAM-dependent methyltransferase [Patescibacteria group bacterium]|nr:class I SAM-dependent methyltransferase [Patescibacteria group bacterium]